MKLLRTLEILRLSGNQLVALPKSLDVLEFLREMDIRGNQMTECFLANTLEVSGRSGCQVYGKNTVQEMAELHGKTKLRG